MWRFWVVLLYGGASLAGPVPTGMTPPQVLDAATREQVSRALAALDYNTAERLLAAASGMRPKVPELLTFLGGIFFLDSKYLNSAIAMAKADRLGGLNSANRFTLAMCYVKLRRPNWARPQLEILAREEPLNPLYPYWLARLDYDDQRFGEALERLNRAIEQDPEFMKAYDNKGLCLEGLGRLDEALIAYSHANELNRLQKPGSPWPSLNMGVLLSKLGRYKEAESCLRESAQYDNRLAQVHYQLGVTLEKTNQMTAAAEELKQAVALDQEYSEPWYALSRIYRKVGERQNAADALTHFQALKRKKSVGEPTNQNSLSDTSDLSAR